MNGKKCKICCSIRKNCMSTNDKIIDTDLLSAIQSIIATKFAISKLSKWSICLECALAIINADILVKKLRLAVETTKRKRRLSVKSTVSDTPKKSKYAKSESIENGSKETGSPEKQIKDVNVSKTQLQSMNGYNSPNKTKSNIELERTTSFCENEDFLNDTVDFNIKEAKSHNSTEISAISSVKKIKKSKKAAKTENSNTSAMQPDVVDSDLTHIKSKTKKSKEMSKNSTMDISNISLSEETLNGSKAQHSTNQEANKPEDRKKFVCDICCKSFKKMSKLQLHVQSVHIENAPNDCPNCGLSFKSQKKFDKHIFSQTCQNSSYSCQQSNCSRMFSKFKDMKKHMENTHAYDVTFTEEVTS